MARLQQKQRVQQSDDEPVAPAELWGQDDEPAVAITLSANLPARPPADDFAPLTFEVPPAQPGGETLNVAGVRFVSAGRLQWCDAADGSYVLGERVLVDTDRGDRVAWIAVAAARKVTRDRGLRRIVRRATDADREPTGEADQVQLLRVAKDKAARLPLKVFRVELTGTPGRGGKLLVYYTTEESRLDMRQFIHELGGATQTRVELRQLGVRDEAKVVGGIGSCGLALCCTTWLPDFVPVSIKMAKDQGLVLSPTKVAGQCGRLKCCLIYEQAGYAELRKGLPKLGKRVVSTRGEGRVVEVDVLRQRVRVSYGMGDSEVLPATDVKPLFPPGTQPPPPGREARGPRGPRPSTPPSGGGVPLPPDEVGADADEAEAEAEDPAESAPIAAPVPEIDLPEPETASPLSYASELPDEDPSRDPSIDDDEEAS